MFTMHTGFTNGMFVRCKLSNNNFNRMIFCERQKNPKAMRYCQVEKNIDNDNEENERDTYLIGADDKTQLNNYEG